MSCDDDSQFLVEPLVIGSSRAIDVVVRNRSVSTNPLVDLSGAKGFFFAKRRIEDASVLFKKKTANVSGGADTQFLILPNQTTTGKGLARIFVLPEDSVDLDWRNPIKVDCWFVLPSGEHKNVLRNTTWVLGPSITPYSERLL